MLATLLTGTGTGTGTAIISETWTGRGPCIKAVRFARAGKKDFKSVRVRAKG